MEHLGWIIIWWCLDAGEDAPPIKVELDTNKANLIKIDRIVSDLEVECCGEGWSRLENDYDNDRYDDNDAVWFL